MHNLEVKSFNPSVSFKNYSLNAHHVPGTVSESSCFSAHSGFSSLTSRNSAKAAPGLPCAWPPLCTPSLRDDVRGSLAAWRIGLGKSPGVFRHCFWPEKQKYPQNSQGSPSLREHTVLSCLQGHFLDKQQLCVLDFWPRAVTVKQGTSYTNGPVKWGNCGFLWMLFLSPGWCWLGYEERELVSLTRYALSTQWR